MGLRPSTMKSGGGRLDGVDVTLVGVRFTDVFPFGDGNNNSEYGPRMYAILSFLVDGADEPVEEPLSMGKAEAFEVIDSDTLEGPVNTNSALGTFITSACANGLDETVLPEGNTINMTALIGSRMRLAQRVNEAKTKEFGKRKDKKTGKPTYDRKDLVVEKFYGLGSGSATGAKKSAGKSGTNGKVNGKAAAGIDLDARAKEILITVLGEADGNASTVAKIGPKVLQQLVKDKDANRKELQDLIKSEAFLGQEDGWTFDAASGSLSL